MTMIFYVVICAAATVFLVACLARAIRLAKAPLHLRWELYPVPHEEAGRVKHGGSYFETADWWTRPAHFNLWGELKVMLPEMLFLKGLWEFNRKLWFRSFPFHFGLYLLIATITLLVPSALLAIFAPSLTAGKLGTGLHHLYTCTGLAGSGLIVAGALGLLHRRLTDEQLRTCNVPGDIFNLLFFLVTFGFLFAGYLFREPSAAGALTIVKGLLSFDTSVKVSGLLAAGLVLGALLVAYIPFTHMSHFIAKYFTYHAVRWDDRPNLRGGELEKKIAEYLTYRPTWAAPHIRADGTRTWAEVATSSPTQQVKR